MPAIKKIAVKYTVDDWEKQLQSEDKAASTVRTRLGYIRRLAKTCSTKKHDLMVHEITAAHIAQVFNTYPKQSPSRNSLFVALNAWLHWCIRMRYITADDVECAIGDRHSRKVERAPKLYLEAALFPKLLNLADGIHPHRRAVIVLLMGTLARDSEISALRLGNVDMESRSVHLTRFKTRDSNRDRITSDWYGELVRWLTWYADNQGYAGDYQAMMLEHPDWYLIPGYQWFGGKAPGGHAEIYPARPFGSIRYVVKAVLDRAGIVSPNGHGKYNRNKGEGGHTFRRSCARAMLQHVEKIEGLQAAKDLVMAKLHHKQWETTAGYIGYDVKGQQLENYVEAGGTLFGVDLSGGENPAPEPEGAQVIDLGGLRQKAQKAAM